MAGDQGRDEQASPDPARRQGSSPIPVPPAAAAASPRLAEEGGSGAGASTTPRGTGGALASTWSPGFRPPPPPPPPPRPPPPPHAWAHSQELIPGGAVASVARISSRPPSRAPAGGGGADDEGEGGAGGGGGDGDGSLQAPLLPDRPYSPPTLPIIPPPPPRPPGDGAARGAARAALATRASLAANVLLLAAKVGAFIASRSRAVQASAVDSLVDLATQLLLAWAAAAAARRDARYPVGKARVTTLGVAGASALMLAATAAVVVEALADLFEGLVEGRPPGVEVGPVIFAVLLGGTALKTVLYLLCARAARTAPPGAGDTLTALAEDHRTDALTAVVAAGAAAAVAFGGPRAWPADPVAALALAVFILAVWSRIFTRTVGKIVGRAAPPEVMAALEGVVSAEAAIAAYTVDVLKAWHAGDALLCECEIVMHPATPLRVSHDVAMRLQHALEAVCVGDVTVERAYVHVDWARREEPEHAPDRVAAAAAAAAAASAGEV